MSKWSRSSGYLSILPDIRVLLLGSYHDEFIPVLVDIRDYLIDAGLENSRIISDFDYPPRDPGEDLTVFILRRCDYWIDQADIFLLIFCKGPDNASAGIELDRILRKQNTGWRTIIAIHERPPSLVEGLGKKHGVSIIDFEFEDDIKALAFGEISGKLVKLYPTVKNRLSGLWESFAPL